MSEPRYTVSESDWRNLIEGIALGVKQMLAPLEARIALLENGFAATKSLLERVEELELHGIRDMGGWQRPVHYRRGDLVSCNSHIWIAVVDNGPDEEPGTCTKWRMARRSPELEQQRQKERRATQGGPRSSSIVERRP